MRTKRRYHLAEIGTLSSAHPAIGSSCSSSRLPAILSEPASGLVRQPQLPVGQRLARLSARRMRRGSLRYCSNLSLERLPILATPNFILELRTEHPIERADGPVHSTRALVKVHNIQDQASTQTKRLPARDLTRYRCHQHRLYDLHDFWFPHSQHIAIQLRTEPQPSAVDLPRTIFFRSRETITDGSSLKLPRPAKMRDGTDLGPHGQLALTDLGFSSNGVANAL